MNLSTIKVILNFYQLHKQQIKKLDDKFLKVKKFIVKQKKRFVEILERSQQKRIIDK